MTEKMVQLVVNTNSWHFRHYCRIRRFYGLDTDIKGTTSLCPYVQSMIWGTIAFAITLPFMILGWLVLKGSRWSYKLAETMGCTWFTDFIDKLRYPEGYIDHDGWYRSQTVGSMMEKSEEDLMDRPFWVLMRWFFITMVSVSVLTMVALVVGMMVCGLVTTIIAHLPSLPWLMVIGVCYLGWAVTTGVGALMFGIATAAAFVWWLIVWFCTTGWFWLLILKIILYTVVVLGICIGVGYTLFQIGCNKYFKRFLSFIALKFNGYQEARTQAFERRAVKEESDVNYHPPLMIRLVMGAYTALHCVLDWVIDLVFSNDFDLGKSTKRIMSPCAMLWHTLVAMKHRACPVVTFTDVNNIIEEEAEHLNKEETPQEGRNSSEEASEETPTDTE